MDESSFKENLSLIKRRHSVRSFSELQIDQNLLRELEADITMLNSHETGFHFNIVTDDPAPFQKFDRSYGMFRNVRDYLACIIDISFPDAYERAGYYAEEFVLKCVSRGVGTCFVGGTFDSSKTGLQMRADWKLPFVVVFGYPYEKERTLVRLMSGFMHRSKRRPEDFYKGGVEEYVKTCEKLPYLPSMLEALDCSPSSMNKKPVRLTAVLENGSPVLQAVVPDENPTRLIDLGIAKYNMGLVADGDWEWGNGGRFITE